MSAPPELPDIVSRAFDVCRQAGYVAFCRNETGRLLELHVKEGDSVEDGQVVGQVG